MRNRTHTLAGVAVSSLLMFADCAADEPGNGSFTEIEPGIGAVSDDSFRFGRYTGLEKEGEFFTGNAYFLQRGAQGRYASGELENLGLESQSVHVEFGTRGKHEISFDYDQLPSFQFDSGQTPFRGTGSSSLTLPANWFSGTPPPIDTTQDMDSLDADLKDVDIEAERKRYRVSTRLTPRKHWSLDAAYQYETREGLDTIAGAIGNSPGNARSALLPEPIDYETNKFDAVLGYAKDKGQFTLAYHLSLYNNNVDSLRWESPFSASGPRGSDGRLALPPDNHFHQVTLSGAYSLPRNTRLTGVLSSGKMTQDNHFQPFTINSGLTAAALPRSSLDGEVNVNTAYVQLNSRPIPPLNLNASYRFHENDNDTPQSIYDYVIADSSPDPLRPAPTMTNEPFSYKQKQATLDAGYRFPKSIRLSLGYDYESISRHTADAEETDEHTYRAKIKFNPFKMLDASIHLARSRRDGSAYTPGIGQNPVLRRYNLADRDRDKAGVGIYSTVSETISLSAIADYIKDDYSHSQVGLTEGKQPTYTLEASYTPSADLSAYAFFTREDIKSKQAGSEIPVEPDWFVSSKTRVDTVGVGFKVDNIRVRWDVGVDYVYSKARGDTDIDAPSGSLTEIIAFPDLTSELNTVSLYALYHLKKNLGVKFAYQYEKFSSKDWARDGVEPDTLSNVLLLGDESPDYNVNVVSVSLMYRY